jgi:hypothetical protein
LPGTLLIQVRRVDFGQQLIRTHPVADVHVPALEVSGRACKMYASVMGVMLPGSRSSLVFAARLTLAELTKGGSVLRFSAAALSCSVIRRLGR